MTTNRRRFLQSAAASVVASTMTSPAFARPTLGRGPLQAFIFDERYAQSVALAHVVRRHGVRLHATRGWLTTLWSQHLLPQWREQPMVVGGLTQGDALFTLESLAADFRMRVVVRGEHSAPSSSMPNHRLRGPQKMVAEVKNNTAVSWCEALGSALAACAFDDAVVDGIELRSREALSKSRQCPTLHSWVLVPRDFAARRV